MPEPVQAEAEPEVTPVTEPAEETAATIAEPISEETPAPVAEETPEATPTAEVSEQEQVAKPAKPIPPPPVAAAPTPAQPQAEEGILDTVMGMVQSVGDTLSIRRGDDEFVVTVEDIGDRRLSPALAAEKYSEDPEAKTRREAAAEQRKLDWQARQERQRRPDKRQRRQIVRFTRKGG